MVNTPSDGVISVLSVNYYPSGGEISVLSDNNHPSDRVISVLSVNYYPSDGVISVLSVNHHPSDKVISDLSVNYYCTFPPLKTISLRWPSLQRRGPNMLLQTSISRLVFSLPWNYPNKWTVPLKVEIMNVKYWRSENTILGLCRRAKWQLWTLKNSLTIIKLILISK